jgi:hypothetical protein
LPIFSRKNAREKGENKWVRRFSLFYSSLGAGYAPRDVRRKIKIYKKIGKNQRFIQKI